MFDYLYQATAKHPRISAREINIRIIIISRLAIIAAYLVEFYTLIVLAFTLLSNNFRSFIKLNAFTLPFSITNGFAEGTDDYFAP